jgi:hypothetical protein
LGFNWADVRNTASILFSWHSGWPRTPFAVIPATAGQPAYMAAGVRNSSRWGNYLSADLKLSTAVPLRAGELTFWLDGTNITNRLNRCCVDLNAASPPGDMPQSETLAWVPRVINVGFTWRFTRSK